MPEVGGGRGKVVIIGMRDESATAEADVTLQQPEAHRVFSLGSCPWITGSWQWQAAHTGSQGVGVEGMWIVTCACTQDS